MSKESESILRGVREAFLIAQGEITSPHETRITVHGERMVTRTIEYGVETRCEIGLLPRSEWKPFCFEDREGAKTLILSPAKWVEMRDSYLSLRKDGSVSWLHLARACPLSLYDDVPYFGFNANVHCGSLTFGEWAEQNGINL